MCVVGVDLDHGFVEDLDDLFELACERGEGLEFCEECVSVERTEGGAESVRSTAL